MGQLKPGATYVYERQGGTVNAREMGAPASERIVIGYDWELDTNPDRVKGTTIDDIRENQLWGEIRRAAKTNKALQHALEECIIIYKLSKEYKDGI